jgi:multiple sugar transport system permease protein/cellobiose transport system permease protein
MISKIIGASSGNLFIYVIVLMITTFSLFPFYVMVMMGTHLSEDLFRGIKLYPGNYLFDNMKTILAVNFQRYYLNSLYISAVATIGGVLICALTGFTFAKYEFRFKNLLFFIVLGTLMVPNELGLVGFVIEMRWLGLFNTHWPLMIPPMANAFGVFWLMQYIKSAIPNEILESARIDGSSDIRMFFQIVLPNITPALITIFLVLFLWSWRSYMIPLVMLNKVELYTIPLAITMLSNMFRVDYAAQNLALTIATIPMVIIFAIGSKHLIRGLMAGSVKG